MESNLTNWVKEKLVPEIYANATTLFPEYEFSSVNGELRSKKHIDGTPSAKGCKIVSKGKYPYSVFNVGGGDDYFTSLVDFYFFVKTGRRNLQKEEFFNVCRELAQLLGIDFPFENEESRKKFEEYKTKQEILREALTRMKKALFSPEGKDVLNYLHNERRYSDEWIKSIELGLLTRDIAEYLNANVVVYNSNKERVKYLSTEILKGRHSLAIPRIEGGTLLGFNFRIAEAISKEELKRQNLQKYLVPTGSKKRGYLLGLQKLGNGKSYGDSVVVVEGELDALIPQAIGLNNFVAVGGGGVTKEELLKLQRYGVNKIILLLDNDERGESFVSSSIAEAKSVGVQVFIARLPEGVKDTDEYISKRGGTKESLQQIVKEAQFATEFLIEETINEANRKGELTRLDYSRLFDKIANILAEFSTSPLEDNFSLTYIKYAIKGVYPDAEDDFENAIKRRVSSIREKKELEKKDKGTERLLLSVADEYKKGTLSTDQALTKLRDESLELSKLGRKSVYGNLLDVPNEKEVNESFRNLPEPIPTKYKFSYFGGRQVNSSDEYIFTIPSGALTMITAPTSHGKSTLLRNIALQVAEALRNDESIYYFSFEESREDVFSQFLNAYAKLELHKPSKLHSQLDAIKDSFRYDDGVLANGELNYNSKQFFYIKKELVRPFAEAKSKFMKEYIYSGRLRVFYEPYTFEKLLNAMEYVIENTKVKAFFIDYIQLLSSEKYSSRTRADQLKEICNKLKDFSVANKVAVVLAGQLNREAKTPFRMSPQNMSESSDIEKSANTILCLWNSNEKLKNYGEKETKNSDEAKELESLKDLGFTAGIAGKLFVSIVKDRGRKGKGYYNVFDFEGEKGYIPENVTKEDAQDSVAQEGSIFNDDNLCL